MISEMIVDADLCIKLGGSEKYKYLRDILPLIAEKIYIHEYTCEEILIPSSALSQLNDLISENRIIKVSENDLSEKDKAVYHATKTKLTRLMIDPRNSKKNKGEVCSLSYAKAKGIPYFATDEKNLQSIIDSHLNTGINDVSCIRIVDIVKMARRGEISVSRKNIKAMWYLSGYSKEVFDKKIWPLQPTSK